MIVVTGNVVSDQPGQLDALEHVETVLKVYEMIQEVFPESFILPILGSQDTYPSHFFPFTDRKTTKYMPSLDKKVQYMT